MNPSNINVSTGSSLGWALLTCTLIILKAFGKIKLSWFWVIMGPVMAPFAILFLFLGLIGVAWSFLKIMSCIFN
jgi:hypothetical protein